MAIRMHTAIRGARPTRTRAQHFHRAAWVLFAFAVAAAVMAAVFPVWGSTGYYMWWIGSAAYVGAAGWSIYLFVRWFARRFNVRTRPAGAGVEREPSFR